MHESSATSAIISRQYSFPTNYITRSKGEMGSIQVVLLCLQCKYPFPLCFLPDHSEKVQVEMVKNRPWLEKLVKSSISACQCVGTALTVVDKTKQANFCIKQLDKAKRNSVKGRQIIEKIRELP